MGHAKKEKYYVPTLGQAIWLRGSDKAVSMEAVCASPFEKRVALEVLQMTDDIHCFGKGWRMAYKAFGHLMELPLEQRTGQPLLAEALQGLSQVDVRWRGACPDELAGYPEFIYAGLVALHVEAGRPSREYLLKYYRFAADMYWKERVRAAA